jgi:alkylation response protein AidB-like acyl-CoA dehydrogenase
MSGTTAEERDDLRRSVRELLTRHCDDAARRAAIDSEQGHDPHLWAQLAELGAPSLAIPDELSGAGYGAVEQAVVLEELGARLAPTPFFGTVVLAASALLASGDLEAQKRLLPGIAEGTTLAALAVVESDGVWKGTDFATRAEQSDGSWRLTGEKTLVIDGAAADLLLVAADTDAGPTLFAVAERPGVARTPLRTLDLTRRMATITLSGATGTPVGSIGAAGPILDAVLDRAMTALAAEQTGAARACLQASVAYARERVQFGRPIGSFQAVKHRCADMFTRVELAAAAADEAAHAADGDEDRAPFQVACAVAHTVCSESAMATAAENIHVHGGIGFTWEHSAHLYFRRAKASQLLFGGPAVHHERLLSRVGL